MVDISLWSQKQKLDKPRDSVGNVVGFSCDSACSFVLLLFFDLLAVKLASYNVTYRHTSILHSHSTYRYYYYLNYDVHFIFFYQQFTIFYNVVGA